MLSIGVESTGMTRYYLSKNKVAKIKEICVKLLDSNQIKYTNKLD